MQDWKTNKLYIYIYIYIYTGVYKDMNNEILAGWFRANKVSLNIYKTKCMLFSRSRPAQSEELFFYNI